jgi:hypothetical protein
MYFTINCFIYLATNVETITHDIIQRGSGWVTRQHSVVFSITVVPSQNLSTPSKGALTSAPLAPLKVFFVCQTSTAACCYKNTQVRSMFFFYIYQFVV